MFVAAPAWTVSLPAFVKLSWLDCLVKHRNITFTSLFVFWLRSVCNLQLRLEMIIGECQPIWNEISGSLERLSTTYVMYTLFKRCLRLRSNKTLSFKQCTMENLKLYTYFKLIILVCNIIINK